MKGSEPRETGWTDDLPRRRGARVATIVAGAGLAVATAGLILNPRQAAPKQVVPDSVLFGVAIALVLLAATRFAIRRKRRGKPSWIEQDRSERALATDNGFGLLLIGLMVLQLFRSFAVGPDGASSAAWGMPIAAVMFGLAVSYEVLRDAHGMSAAPFRFAKVGSSDATRAGFAVLLLAACIVATLDAVRPDFLSPLPAVALAAALAEALGMTADALAGAPPQRIGSAGASTMS